MSSGFIISYWEEMWFFPRKQTQAQSEETPFCNKSRFGVKKKMQYSECLVLVVVAAVAGQQEQESAFVEATGCPIPGHG